MSTLNSFYTSQEEAVDPGADLGQITLTIENFKTALSRGKSAFASEETAKGALSLEGLSNPAQRSDFDQAVKGLRAVINTAAADTAFVKNRASKKLSVSQENAAIAVGMMGQSAATVRAYMGMNFSAERFARESSGAVAVGHAGIEGAKFTRDYSPEAFDERQNDLAQVHSMTYQLGSANQDVFNETLYPIVVIPPNHIGFMTSITVNLVYDAYTLSTNGAAPRNNRKNVIKAFIDPSILRNDQTRIIPVYRKTTPAAASDNDVMFSADVTPYAATADGNPILTAPYAFGKAINILSTSQTDAMLSVSSLDETDALDNSIRLNKIYVRLVSADGNTVNIVPIDVSIYSGTDFNAPPQGNTQDMQLAWSTSTLFASATTKKIDGTPAGLLSPLGANTARLAWSVFGNATQDTGMVKLTAGPLTVATIKSNVGVELPTASGAGATAAAAFLNATVVGYDLIAHRINSNKRTRGQLTDTQTYKYLFSVPFLPPMSAQRPLNNPDVNDQQMVQGLLNLTKARQAKDCVESLLNHGKTLKLFSEANDQLGEGPEILGISRHVLDLAYIEENLNVATSLDSLNAVGRIPDVEALIQNKVRDVAIRLYIKSGWKAAADCIYGGNAPKPCVIIATDQLIGRYMTLQGDLRLMGEAFDYKLVYSVNKDMVGKIIVSLGTADAIGAGVANVLHPGVCAYRPEMTMKLPMPREGRIAMEITAQPSWRYINNCPVQGVINVTGIEAVVAAKVAINNHPV